VLKDGCAITVVVDVEHDTVALPAQYVGQYTFALFDWSTAQIFAINLDQVEGAKDSGMVMPPGAEQVKGSEAPFIDHDGLTVDEAGPHFKLGHGLK
jgi:hypothetical protein